MHIPDGYLSPQTICSTYVLSLPIYWYALQKLKQENMAVLIPKIALLSAFSFVIMMFNIPLPGGTTGHATGASLASLIIGPEKAVIAIGIAVFIQALFFGDGGLLSFGVNALILAILIPFVTSYIFRFLRMFNIRDTISAFVASYLGLNAGALGVAILLGIQPLLFTAHDGSPQYFPFNMYITIPAMMIGHLMIAGIAEAFVTSSIIIWIKKIQPSLIPWSENKPKPIKISHSILIGFMVLVLFLPIGLLAPGTAWGEWGRDELLQLGLSTIPEGYDKLSTIFISPIPDYVISFLPGPVSYILSGCIGIGLCFLFIYVFTKIIQPKNNPLQTHRVP